MPNNDWKQTNISVPVIGDTPMMVAVIVLGALGFLIAIERGFRTVKIG